jgi:hypothetical protein
MAAHDNISNEQFDQLAMLMPAKDLMGGQYRPGDALDAERYGPADTEVQRATAEQRMWSAKTAESDVPGTVNNAHWATHPNFVGEGSTSLIESVRDRGVRHPVQIFHSSSYGSMIGDGHHRIAAAHAVDPNMEVPVAHEVDPFEIDEPSFVQFGSGEPTSSAFL